MNLFSDKTNLLMLVIIVVLVLLIFNLLWSRVGDKSKLFKDNDANNSKNYMKSQNFTNTNTYHQPKHSVNNDKNEQNTINDKVTATDNSIFSEKNINTTAENSSIKTESINTVEDNIEPIISPQIANKTENDIELNNKEEIKLNDQIETEPSTTPAMNNVVNEAIAEAAIAEDRILDQGLTPTKEVRLGTNSIGENSTVNRAVNKAIVQTSQEQQLAEELIDKAEKEQQDKIYKQSLKKDNQAMALVRILPRGDYFIAEKIFEESKKCGFYFNEIDKCFEYPIQQGQYKEPIFKLIQDVAPGRFELEDLYKQIKGIVVFTRFCYSGDSVNNVRIMLSRAKLLANRLEADLCDNDFKLITPEYEQTILAIAKKYRPEVQK